MTQPAPDPRRHAYRPDLADAALRGTVEAGRFVEPQPAWVCAPVAALRQRPENSAPRDTEVLFGEALRIFEIADGWAWVQLATDGYVGYVAEESVRSDRHTPTHRVVSRSALVYSDASALSEPVMHLPLNARICVRAVTGQFAELETGGFAGAEHLAASNENFAADFVGVAEGFAGVPYLYGGRSAVGGIDCSGLVQMALAAAGIAAPRDSDMQAGEIGAVVAEDRGELSGLQRGDLIFWPGHVAIMTSPTGVVHASATTMCVAHEPLAVVAARSRKDGPLIRRVRRLRQATPQ